MSPPYPSREFRGRSLAFVRTVMNKSEPRAISAYAMAERYKDQLVRVPSQLQVGMVCFWGLQEPGDCGIYVGDGRVLCLDHYGIAVVRSLLEVATNFLGGMYWPSVPAKKVGVRDGT